MPHDPEHPRAPVDETASAAASAATIEARITELLAELRLDEKLAMLSGRGFREQCARDGRYGATLYRIAAGNERLGMPPLLFADGGRGVVTGSSTCFPVPIARAASFDVELEERIGEAIGRELRAHGGNLFGGVCINLLRHPAWGRAQESYGEDPFLLGEMGAALVRGVSRHNVVATVKHLAANSMENARFTVNVRIDERALQEVYLPHFRRCIAAGAGAVMSAYNRVNGDYCGHNRELLTRILREEWGFDGFVYSDFLLGCRGTDAIDAGLDVEAPEAIHYGVKLRNAVVLDEVSGERIDEAVRRVLRPLLRVLAAEDPETYGPERIACAEHVELSREAARRSIVLLENDGVLPWPLSDMRKLLVLGELADRPNLGDHGSSRVDPPHAVTPLAGLRAGAPRGCRVVFDAGEDPARVRTLAAEADAVLVVAGYTHRDEGEFIPGRSDGGDRTDLGLGTAQEALILAAAEANPRVVVALMAGSAVLAERWRHAVAGLVMLWYPGMEGGTALADVLFGRVSPAGRLPFSVPEHTGQLPFFDRDATEIRYDLWHGYTRLDREGLAPAYPFGFGLSYTEFVFADLEARIDDDSIHVGVEVANTGTREGATVVQLYAGEERPGPDQPVKRLCGFRRVPLDSGERRRVEVEVPIRRLACFDPVERCWRVRGTRWRILAGPSSAEKDLLSVTVELAGRSWPR